MIKILEKNGKVLLIKDYDFGMYNILIPSGGYDIKDFSNMVEISKKYIDKKISTVLYDPKSKYWTESIKIFERKQKLEKLLS